MNRKELIDALAARTGSTKADADRNIAALIDIITATLKKGDNLALVGFGTFEVRKRAARTAHRPQPGNWCRDQDQGSQGSCIQGGRQPEDGSKRQQEVIIAEHIEQGRRIAGPVISSGCK